MTRGTLNYDLWLNMHFFLGGDIVVFVHDFRDVDLWYEVSLENIKPCTHRRKITSFLSSLSPSSSYSSSFSSKRYVWVKLHPCFRNYIVFPSTPISSQYVVYFWGSFKDSFFPRSGCHYRFHSVYFVLRVRNFSVCMFLI